MDAFSHIELICQHLNSDAIFLQKLTDPMHEAEAQPD
jgi:hypothetical protein